MMSFCILLVFSKIQIRKIRATHHFKDKRQGYNSYVEHFSEFDKHQVDNCLTSCSLALIVEGTHHVNTLQYFWHNF